MEYNSTDYTDGTAIPKAKTDEPTSSLSSMNELLVQQMQHELTNSYIYLNFANQADCKALFGATKFFHKQADDEVRHFNLIREYLCDRVGMIPLLRSIPAQEFNVEMVLNDMILAAFALEVATTQKLVAIQKEALMEMDMLTFETISKLIVEQLEEEKLFSDLVNRFKMFGDNPASILLLDQELGSL
jgi:ferritin